MFLGEIFLYNPGKKKMSTKSDLQDEVDRLNAVVASQNATIQTQADTILQKNRDLVSAGNQIESLKSSNLHTAKYADYYRELLEKEQIARARDIMNLTDKALKAMYEIADRAKHHTELEVERARTDTLSQCFDRALQTAAGNVGSQSHPE